MVSVHQWRDPRLAYDTPGFHAQRDVGNRIKAVLKWVALELKPVIQNPFSG